MNEIISKPEVFSAGLSIDALDRRTATASRRKRPPSGSAPPAQASRYAHYVGHSLLALTPFVFGVATLAVLGLGWLYSDEGYLSPKNGAGYWLGIAGSTMMAILMLYPLRKRFRAFHGLGRVTHWFRLHMMLGIIGPVLIILHSNYKLGSLNSSAALATMLVVVISGIIGRYIYARVHRGLYGASIGAREMLGDAGALAGLLGDELGSDPLVIAELQALLRHVNEQPRSFLASLWQAMTIGGRIRGCRRRVARHTRRVIADAGLPRGERRSRKRRIAADLALYFAAVGKAARFAVFERLFAMWHVLHFPLFIALVFTVTLHIVAVHLF